jgi:hypothetical protein
MNSIIGFSAKKIVVMACVVFIAIIIYYYFFKIIPNGELGQKEIWSVLQGVEQQHRSDLDSKTPIFVERAIDSEYNLLGIPTDNQKFPRVWLVLNKIDDTNKVYIIPKNLTLILECSYIDAVQSKTKIEPSVLSFLMSVCQGEKSKAGT